MNKNNPSVIAAGSALPSGWLPAANPQRIITHWTAGGYKVNDDDRQHYHFIIDGACSIYRGAHLISANDATKDGIYAAHTRGLNTCSIGVAVACMAGAQEFPFIPGQAPMKPAQWYDLARLCAMLAHHYKLKVTPRTILGHGEVEQTYAVAQRGKWDPLCLPWDPTVLKRSIAAQFRDQVTALLPTEH